MTGKSHEAEGQEGAETDGQLQPVGGLSWALLKKVAGVVRAQLPYRAESMCVCVCVPDLEVRLAAFPTYL